MPLQATVLDEDAVIGDQPYVCEVGNCSDGGHDQRDDHQGCPQNHSQCSMDQMSSLKLSYSKEPLMRLATKNVATQTELSGSELRDKDMSQLLLESALFASSWYSK
jgi:hypothetical protein